MNGSFLFATAQVLYTGYYISGNIIQGMGVSGHHFHHSRTVRHGSLEHIQGLCSQQSNADIPGRLVRGPTRRLLRGWGRARGRHPADAAGGVLDTR